MAEGAMLQQSWLPRLQAHLHALPGRRLHPPSTLAVRHNFPPLSVTVGGIEDGGDGDLSGRDRRHLRNERRESRASVLGNWREEVEERLMVKPKKKKTSSTEKLNLDNLALLGPQWWMLRMARGNSRETAEMLARAFVRNYPDREFKMYLPTVKTKKKLKNGTVSIKMKPIVPGCIFLYCVVNKEIHDFVRGYVGIRGFLGTMVGNSKRQIYRPTPMAADEMEALFKRVEEEQELVDQDFQKHHAKESSHEDFEAQSSLGSIGKTNSASPTKQKRKSGKSIESNDLLGGHDSLVPGSSVRVLSGPFTDYIGYLKKVNGKTGKVTVGFMLFGNQSFVELEVDQIVVGE